MIVVIIMIIMRFRRSNDRHSLDSIVINNRVNKINSNTTNISLYIDNIFRRRNYNCIKSTKS